MSDLNPDGDENGDVLNDAEVPILRHVRTLPSQVKKKNRSTQQSSQGKTVVSCPSHALCTLCDDTLKGLDGELCAAKHVKLDARDVR